MNVVIPSKIDGKKVTSIGELAFSPDNIRGISYDKNVIINSVVIPNSVTHIGDLAFEGNQLDNITISNFSNLEIGFEAFANNPLNNLPDSTREEILNINVWAFSEPEI